MMTLARQFVFVALAGALSWWLFLRPVAPAVTASGPRLDELSVALVPTPPAAAPVEQVRAEREQASEPAPPPPELGAPNGADDAEAEPVASAPSPPDSADESSEKPALEEPAVEEPAVEEDPDDQLAADAPGDSGEARGDESTEAVALAETSAAAAPQPSVRELMNDAELVEAARREMTGEVRRGFATVIVSAPEDQLDLARAFGEELVLVPKAALDPENPGRWYRLELDGGARVVPVDGPVPLGRYTQYRDLFAFDYERLPEALRTLRRQVVARSDVYLFAALIPAAEWAVVIGRREDALTRSTRDLEGVERFVLRAVRQPTGSFDFAVDEIKFADGSSFRLSQPRR